MAQAVPGSATTATSSPFRNVAQQIVDAGVRPLDALHLTAMLEMRGWTDRRALTIGLDTVFDMAIAMFPIIQPQIQVTTIMESDQPPLPVRIWLLFRTYLRGISFSLPMMLSSGSVLVLRYSLWSYVDFDTEIATAIALGTFTSFLVAGGFSQAIARRGLFYISQVQYGMARRSSVQFLWIGLLSILAAALILWTVIILVPVLPWRVVGIAALYFVPLTLIWLGVAILYMLKQETVILALIAIGIGIVYLMQLQHLGMMVSQVIGMTAVAIGACIIGIFNLVRLQALNAKESEVPVQIRWSQVTRSLAPFFLYGIAYFALVFLDRIVAWTTPGEYHPYFIWFEGRYELGLDWALWTLVLPVGVVEIYLESLYKRILKKHRVTSISDTPAFNQHFRRGHLWACAGVVLAGLVGMVLVLKLMDGLYGVGLLPYHPLGIPITRMVFYFAAPAFSIIAVGLQNVLILFSLNEPWAATRACAAAVMVDLLVGFLASRYLGFHFAVLGLVAGAIAFALFSGREALRVLERLDYFLMRTT